MATRQIVPSILASLLLVLLMTQTVYRRQEPPEKGGQDKMESITQSSIGKVEPGQLIFSEEFDHINLSLWEPVITMSGCGSGEFQMYDKNPENIFVKDGVLHIQPTLTADKYGEDFLYNGNLVMENCTDPLYSGCNKTAGNGYILNPVISARLRTLRTFSFLYGRVEARAKIPAGDWIWPAIWMNPRDMVYGSWPMSGEVDIMESRGNNYLYDGEWVNVGNRQVQSSLHFGPDRSQDKWRLAHGSKNSYIGFDQEFHRYQLEWTPEYMTLGIDDEVIKVIKPPTKGGMYEFGQFTGPNIWENASNPVMAPFDQQFYFIINVAVGSTRGFFSDSSVNIPYEKPWKNSDSMEAAMLSFWNERASWLPTWSPEASALRIDYIRVWAL